MSKEFCSHVYKLTQVSYFGGTVILRFRLSWKGLKTSNCILNFYFYFSLRALY